MSRVDKIIKFESGELDELDEQETIELFQELVDDGFIHQLQGYYGRTAQSLINQGLVTA